MTNAAGPRVIVVDDSAALAESFAEALRDHGIDVVGIAENGSDGIALAREADPDVVLMDLRMPVMDGISATRSMTAAGLRAKIVMMTAHEDDTLVRRATDAGAVGYLVKGTLISDAAAAIRAVAAR